MQKSIEIELRSVFSKEKYNDLLLFLQQNCSQDLWEDDKNVFFFILPDKLIKVVHNISKWSAKIVLKLNKIGLWSDFEEIEIPVSTDEVAKAVMMFQKLGYNEIQESFQKRHNFIFNNVEIAVKYSDSWWYHAELEIVVDDISKKGECEEMMQEVAHELGIKIMTDSELQEFTAQIDRSFKKK